MRTTLNIKLLLAATLFTACGVSHALLGQNGLALPVLAADSQPLDAADLRRSAIVEQLAFPLTAEIYDMLAPLNDAAVAIAIEQLNMLGVNLNAPYHLLNSLRSDNMGNLFQPESPYFNLPPESFLFDFNATMGVDLPDVTTVMSVLPLDMLYQSDGEVPSEAVVPSEEDVFSLHSLPMAQNVIYLDFDGEYLRDTAWSHDRQTFPFSLDQDRYSLSESERMAIVRIWHFVAEHYAAYNVNVTTQRPFLMHDRVQHTLITEPRDVNGDNLPSFSAGGVAYLNTFATDRARERSPAFVYSDPDRSYYRPVHHKAHAAAHEIGHNMGLLHDGLSLNGSYKEYYAGHGSGSTRWGPIMGYPVAPVSQWSRGEYPGANNSQDDIAILESKLGLRPDDHGNDAASATLLEVDEFGVIASSNTATDTHNRYRQNKGVIEQRDDIDVFQFSTAAGSVSLSVKPAWVAFSQYDASLDVKLVLKNAADAVVATADPQDRTDASINVSLEQGTYTLEISGAGSTKAPYSNYGAQGFFFIAGQVIP